MSVNNISSKTDTNAHMGMEMDAIESLAQPVSTDIDTNLEDIHQPSELVEEKKPENKKATLSSGVGRIITDPDRRNIFISGVNAALHGIATMTNFLAKNNKSMESVNNVFNTAAFFFTKWLVPITSYGYSAVEALWDTKPILSLIKLLPPGFLPLVGDANIDTVYGASTGFNQPYDMVEKRLANKAEESVAFKQELDEANKTFWGNTKMITREFINMTRDFLQGKTQFWKEGIYFINCFLMILPGALPILAFARNARDTMMARVLGLWRNLGGILGDIGLMFGEENKNPYKFGVGVLCSISATADIAKRWVNEDMSKVLIHLGAALNVSAYTLWNAFNSKHKKQEVKKVEPVKQQARVRVPEQETLNLRERPLRLTT